MISDIFFACFLFEGLYFCGFIQWCVNVIGKIFNDVFGLSAAEATAAAGNVFLPNVRPFAFFCTLKFEY